MSTTTFFVTADPKAPRFENAQSADTWLQYSGGNVAEMYANAYTTYCTAVRESLNETPVDMLEFIAGFNASRDLIFKRAMQNPKAAAAAAIVLDVNREIQAICPQMVRLNEAYMERMAN